jgi:hypothetical protein
MPPLFRSAEANGRSRRSRVAGLLHEPVALSIRQRPEPVLFTNPMPVARDRRPKSPDAGREAADPFPSRAQRLAALPLRTTAAPGRSLQEISGRDLHPFLRGASVLAEPDPLRLPLLAVSPGLRNHGEPFENCRPTIPTAFITFPLASSKCYAQLNRPEAILAGHRTPRRDVDTDLFCVNYNAMLRFLV